VGTNFSENRKMKIWEGPKGVVSSIGLGTHLFAKVPRPGDSEVIFSVFESSSQRVEHKIRGFLKLGQVSCLEQMISRRGFSIWLGTELKANCCVL